MEEEQEQRYISPFDAIRRFQADNHEYWSARDLSKLLGYTEYGKFKNAIRKAEQSCEAAGEAISDHFAHVSDMINIGSRKEGPYYSQVML